MVGRRLPGTACPWRDRERPYRPDPASGSKRGQAARPSLGPCQEIRPSSESWCVDALSHGPLAEHG
jgi:hypothetical protein